MGTELAIGIIFGLLDRVASYAALVQKAKAEGRDVSDAELDALAAEDDVARKDLEAAIKRRRGA